MNANKVLQEALKCALNEGSQACPPILRQAMAEAVLAGGARLRPQLCLAVAGVQVGVKTDAAACPKGPFELQDNVWAAAVALELLHCASLVHDDMPCFDDASVRRGRPTIHARFGEAMAVLVGDALIMTAFAQVSRLVGPHAAAVSQQIAHAARRMVWGQALESEPQADLGQYHSHKTAALFEAAAVCGAWLAPKALGNGPQAAHIDAWRAFGAHIGGLYQLADDILDVACAQASAQTGAQNDKSAGRDGALGRPNAALQLGLGPARARLEMRLHKARQAIVEGPQHEQVTTWFFALEQRLAEATGLWRSEGHVPLARRPSACSASPAPAARQAAGS